MSIYFYIFICIVLIYSFVIQPKICKKKIYTHINCIGGEVEQIEILSLREGLYSVDYIRNNENKRAIVRFDITFEADWKM